MDYNEVKLNGLTIESIKEYFTKYCISKNKGIGRGSRPNEYISEMRKYLIIELKKIGLKNEEIGNIVAATRTSINHRMKAKECSDHIKNEVSENIFKWIKNGLYPETVTLYYKNTKRFKDSLNPDLIEWEGTKSSIRELTLIKL